MVNVVYSMSVERGGHALKKRFWNDEQAFKIVRENLERFRKLDRMSAQFMMRFGAIVPEDRRSAACELCHLAEECSSEDVFRRAYRMYLDICEDAKRFPRESWRSLRATISTAREEFVATIKPQAPMDQLEEVS